VLILIMIITNIIINAKQKVARHLVPVQKITNKNLASRTTSFYITSILMIGLFHLGILIVSI
jgi:hypothetical protein